MSYINIISIICIILILCIIAVFIESGRECKKFHLKKYDIHTDKLPADARLRIVMLADLHNTVFDENNDSVVSLIEEQKPDIIILAGDMIVCGTGLEEESIRTAEFIERISGITSVYYGVGNHEKGVMNRIHNAGELWEKYSEKLFDGKSDKIQFMDNKSELVSDIDYPVMLYGLDLERSYYKRFVARKLEGNDLNALIGKKSNDYYNILIAHNPDYFDAYAEWGADLILSGHNHGGLVRLPVFGGVISPRLRIFPKYDHGMYEKGDTKMILTNGMGAHSLKIRVNNIPEVVLIEVFGK